MFFSTEFRRAEVIDFLDGISAQQIGWFSWRNFVTQNSWICVTEFLHAKLMIFSTAFLRAKFNAFRDGISSHQFQWFSWRNLATPNSRIFVTEFRHPKCNDFRVRFFSNKVLHNGRSTGKLNIVLTFDNKYVRASCSWAHSIYLSPFPNSSEFWYNLLRKRCDGHLRKANL